MIFRAATCSVSRFAQGIAEYLERHYGHLPVLFRNMGDLVFQSQRGVHHQVDDVVVAIVEGGSLFAWHAGGTRSLATGRW